MLYNHKGKNLNIPDKEIENNMKILELSKEEAIQVWLEDNEYEINEEQDTLDKQAKQTRIKHDAHTFTPRPRKPRERKEDPEKENIISFLAECLQTKYENIKVVNVGKIIEFDIADNHYKIDLVRQRKKKGG